MGAVDTRLVSAKSDNAGTITFPAFDQAPRGTVLQGTVSVPAAPVTASFAAKVQGQQIGTFAGFNPWGPIQLGQGSQLQITGTGLTASTEYQAVWVVGQYPDSAAPAPPIPYGGVTQISSTTNNPVVVEVIQLPTPPANFAASDKVTATGSAQQLNTVALTIGAAIIADPANVGSFYIGGSTVSTSSAYLSPGQSVVIPVDNLNIIWVLGTLNDHLSVWGA